MNYKKAEGLAGKLLPVLAILLIVFASLSSLVVGKYVSTTNSNNTVSVAAFAVEIGNFTSGNLSIDCNTGNTTTQYQFQISNQKNNVVTQVAVQYYVTVTLPSSLPNGMTMTIDGISGSTTNSSTYTFTCDTWQFSAGERATASHTLTFSADPNTVTQDYTLSGITINVVAEQID